jgi:Putative bacterial sensory transduction regulator
MDGQLATVRPLTNELITAVLDAREFTYFTDDDGDVGGWWEDNLVYFFRLGTDHSMLQVRIRARRSFVVEDVPRLYEFCNTWNHDKLWPKAYVHVNDDGSAIICGEVFADLERGVTLQQLDQLMMCGISTGCEMATAADEL